MLNEGIYITKMKRMHLVSDREGLLVEWLVTWSWDD